MNSFIELVNAGGDRLWHFAGPMLWQSSLLILALFVIDFIFRRRLRASIRYALWLVVLIKLLLPPTLALPTGAAWWLRHSETQPLPPAPETKMIVTYSEEIIPSFAPPDVSPVTTKPSISVHGWLLLGCTIVSIALLAWMLSRWILVMRQVRRAATPPDSVLPLLQHARELSGWKHQVRVQVTGTVMSPAVCGLFHPVILLPKLLIEQLSPEQIRAVLVHELVHLKRGDVFVNCVQALLQVIYWWHPLFWFANARIRRVREEAVDDAVMLALRDDADSYAPTLLEVAKLAFDRPLATLGLIGILESRSALRQRIERLLHFPTPRRAGLSVSGLLTVVAFTAVAVPMGEKPLETKTQIAALNPKTSNPSKTEAHIFQLSHSNAFEVVSGDVNFDANTRILTASNDVVISADKQVLRADAIELDENTRKITARGNVQVAIQATSRRLVIMDKVKNVRLGYIAYDSATLNDVVQDLNRQVRERDPERKGIDFSIRLSSSSPSLIDPKTGLMISDSSRSNEISSTRITIRPGLIEPTLHEVLDVIVKSANRPLHYSISENGIAIVPETADGPRLHMRTFKVDTGTFIQNLKSTGVLAPEIDMSSVDAGDRAAMGEGMLKWFTKLGLDFSPETGKNIFWNPGNGTMLVRAEIRDMDIIEHALGSSNQPPFPQISIKTRFVDLPEENLKEFLESIGVTNSKSANVTAVLSATQMKKTLDILEKRDGAELFNQGEVTTLSGRQAQIQVVEIRDFPGITNRVPIGPTLDVLPTVTPDERAISLKATATVVDFIGIDDSGPAMLDPKTGKEITDQSKLPRFRVRQKQTDVTLPDGGTLVLFGGSDNEITLGKEAQPRPFKEDPKHRLLVFVTATLIDADGNRIHP